MCGIFGACLNKEDANSNIPVLLTAESLSFYLQHRGQESAGIAYNHNGSIQVKKGLGLALQVFDDKFIQRSKSNFAIGHVRYGTTGGSSLANAQPQFKCEKYAVAVAHNGNLVNTNSLRSKLEAKGVNFSSTSDTEIIAVLIAKSQKPTLEEAIIESCKQIKGSYSLIILSNDQIFGVRDPLGIRPLMLGKINYNNVETYMLSSEDCAFTNLGGVKIRDIAPGELIEIRPSSIRSSTISNSCSEKLCIFEYVYFSRPDSNLLGRSIYGVRKKMGIELAKEIGNINIDSIIGIPDSGLPAAIGFSEKSEIPLNYGLIKNRYVGRTFISPINRASQVQRKLSPLVEEIKNKKIGIVDDSIVRGTTTKKIVKMLRDYGAREIHLLIASPPVIGPCFFGIDTADEMELIAHKLKNNVSSIRNFIGSDSLHYLSLQGLARAISLPTDNFCMACFNRHYPIKVSLKSKNALA